MAQYGWKLPQLYSSVDPQVAGEFIQGMQCRRGEVLPHYVVEESRPEEAILHSCFEWQDDIAAEKYREEQARSILRNIIVYQEIPESVTDKKVVQVVESLPQPAYTRAFVNVKQQGSKYVSMETAMSDEDLRRQLVARALEELTWFRRKHAELSELAEVFEVIDRLTR